MLSAENASLIEVTRQQRMINQRIRTSLLNAPDLEWNKKSKPESNVSRVSIGSSQKRSQSTFVPRKHIPSRRAVGRAALKNIQKFEIILYERKKPEEIEKALTAFRRDSLNSLKEGVAVPSIRNYVDVNASAYEPGEDVAGHINISLSKEMPVAELAIRLKGLYLVAFEQKTEGESTTSTEQITFLEEDAAFNISTEQMLQPGMYKYIFKFKLPLNIPGSMFFERFQTVYEGASVVYSVEAMMRIKHAEDEYYNSPVAKEIIEVMKRVPERKDPILHRPYNVDKDNNVLFCCYNLGKMSLGVTIDRMLYSEGDEIKMEISLSNDSKLKAKRVTIELIQNSAFKSKTQNGYVLKARSTLLVHNLPLDDLGYGDATNRLVLTLPDEMQASTISNIVPPSSFFDFNISKQQPIRSKSEQTADSIHKQAVADMNNSAVEEIVMPEEVKLEDAEPGEATYIILDTDYHKLYEISYHLHVKLRSSSEWCGMKGPEIYFPITVESADAATRKKKAELRQLQEQNKSEPNEEEDEEERESSEDDEEGEEKE